MIGPVALNLVPTDAQWEHIRADLHALCRTVAPLDLQGPLYIIFKDDLADASAASNIRGLWGPGIDLLAKDVLGDRWQGRGVGLLIDVMGCWADAFSVVNPSDLMKDSSPWLVEILTGVALHELAHEFQNNPPRSRALPPDHRIAALTAAVARDALHAQHHEQLKPKSAMPMSGHGPKWIRVCAHLLHRAELAGVVLGPAFVCPTASYSLSPVHEYIAALGDEPHRFERLTFAEIRRLPMPPAFRELFQSDLATWSASVRSHRQKGSVL